jgi:antitoxin MazE
MTAKLIAIGNSRGIRLPKSVIEQCGLGDEIELEVRDGCLILRSSKAPRAGWEEAFERMHAAAHDRLLDVEAVSQPSEWDESEWKW